MDWFRSASLTDQIAMLGLAFTAFNSAFLLLTFFYVRTVKHATNSIMDAALKDAKIAAEAKGKEKERVRQEEKNARS